MINLYLLPTKIADRPRPPRKMCGRLAIHVVVICCHYFFGCLTGSLWYNCTGCDFGLADDVSDEERSMLYLSWYTPGATSTEKNICCEPREQNTDSVVRRGLGWGPSKAVCVVLLIGIRNCNRNQERT